MNSLANKSFKGLQPFIFLFSSIWEAERETVFLVHGYMQGGDRTPWMMKMKDELLMNVR